MQLTTILTTLLCVSFGIANADAQNYSESDLQPEQFIKLRLSASKPGQYSLEHRLFPSDNQLFDRNAAIHYHRAVYMFDTAEARQHAQNVKGDEGWGYSNDFTNAQLTPETVKRLRAWLSFYEPMLFDEINFATHSRDCDWQIFPEEAKTNWFLRTLPEVQGCRGLARYLAAKARIEIMDGEYSQACETIQCGYRIGADLQKSKVLVGSLVGIACIDIMRQPLLELLQKTDSPNLYWSFATLPDDMTDIRDSIRAELSMLRDGSGFDLLNNPEKDRTAEGWRESLKDYADRMMLISAVTGMREIMPPTIIRSYPMAKQLLLNNGMAPEKVETMNSIQVVAIADNILTGRLVDEYEKGLTLSNADAEKYFAKLERNETVRSADGKHISDLPLLWHSNSLMPAVRQIFSAGAKSKRRLAALQVIEGIRLHLGETGSLPNSLDEIKTVPVPNNPETGKPFRYVSDGKTAKLFDFGQAAYQATVYEITSARK